jgi:nitrous oxidase accessory protein
LIETNGLFENLRYGINLEFTNDTLLFGNSVYSNDVGFYLQDGNGIVIAQSRIFDNYNGIQINRCSVDIESNNISYNTHDGIHAFQTECISICDNLVIGNTGRGIVLGSISKGEVFRNMVKENHGDGISSLFSNSINVAHNVIEGNREQGIQWWYGNQSDTIQSNIIRGNHKYGVKLWDCISVSVRQNDFSFNEVAGLFAYQCEEGGYICENSFESNSIGLLLSGGCWHSQIFRNDFIDNHIINVKDDSIRGNFSQNYYSDYTGSDEDNDGFGDVPYPIPGLASNYDQSPRMEPLDV